jgi:Tol biopolymer transport system component/DNA-binding winged helix-turn-helix (wHTH) protein
MHDPDTYSRNDDVVVNTAAMAPFRIGDWQVKPSLNRILWNDEQIQVEPRVMHVLACLASRPGQVLSRSALLKAVWGDAVVCEEALTRTISELRRIFRDDPRSPRVIETIRKGGYRLIAPVIHPITAESPSTRTSTAPSPTPRDTVDVRGIMRSRRAAGIGILLILASIAWAIVLHLLGPQAPPASIALQGIPFTSYPGNEYTPAFSPDGMQVAFAWDGGEGRARDIFLKQRNTASPLRLTDDPADEVYPTWSPDGSTIAFLRFNGNGTGIYSVPAIGGLARRLTSVASPVHGLDWSPDGKWLIYAARAGEDRPYQIMRLSLETLVATACTSPSADFAGDLIPEYSPDGRSIAFVRSNAALMHDLYVMPAAGGQVRRLTRCQRRMAGLDWTPDAAQIIFSAAPTGNFDLWRLTVSDGSVTRLPTRSASALTPTIAPQGNSLIYVDHSFDYNIWHVKVGEDHELEPAVLISSTRVDHGARYSPDGRRLAFISTRSGSHEIWASARDGSSPRQLTTFGGTYLMNPRWSPAGDRLAFSAAPGDYASVFVMDVESCRPERLTDGDHHEILAAWSRDGEWLYTETHRGEGWQIWKMLPDGTGCQPVLTDGRHLLFESSDGHLYYLKTTAAGLWKIPVAGGDEVCVLDQECLAEWCAMAVADRGIYSIRRTADAAALFFHDFATSQTDSLGQLPGYVGRELSLSPDGTVMLFDRAERIARDLILVENFR